MRTLEEPFTLVDELLAEQRTLTAVEKFTQLHQRHQAPLLEPHYRDLIPLSSPRPGEQYAFEVDLDKCSGCKACVSACHSLNGLDDDESWRKVGALFGERLVPKPSGGNRVVPLQQTVTTACHHCVEPACLEGCPVLAYDKDPVTGIVRHLSDQCIGCSYCVMKCPYDVPKFSAKRGIVRKCDMCHDRLAVGEAPACVQACPSEAIRITLTRLEAVKLAFRAPNGCPAGRVWLPDSPQPGYTLPTTRYITTKPEAVLHAADHFTSRLSPAHWPLLLMLVLTQAGMGGMVLAAKTSEPFALMGLSFAILLTGLVASFFHLGQPAKAWRVWLGWRTSWLSREAMALGAFAAIAGLALTANEVTLLGCMIPFPSLSLALMGLVTVTAQTMVYADTHREFWRFASTFPRFIGTATVLGLALKFAFSPDAATAAALVLFVLIKLGFEMSVTKEASVDTNHWTQLRRTALLQLGPLRPLLAARFLLTLTGGVLIPFGVAVGAVAPPLAKVTCVLCFAGEIAERYLFFTTVAPDKMPGQA